VGLQSFILAPLPVLAQRKQTTGQTIHFGAFEGALKAAGANPLRETEPNGIGALLVSAAAPISSSVLSNLDASIIAGNQDPSDLNTLTSATAVCSPRQFPNRCGRHFRHQ